MANAGADEREQIRVLGVSLYREYKRLQRAARDAEAIIADGSDPELAW